MGNRPSSSSQQQKLHRLRAPRESDEKSDVLSEFCEMPGFTRRSLTSPLDDTLGCTQTYLTSPVDDTSLFTPESPLDTWQPYNQKTNERYDEKGSKLAPLKPKEYKNVSVKHKTKFEKLFNVWGDIKRGNHGDIASITEVHGNGVCFQDEFLIGRGSYGTQVYICLGFDGMERAIKRLPKDLCQKFLKNERDILSSPNAVDSPRIVNYWFYDDTTSPDFGYLILDLYEQNLEEYLKAERKTMTETSARRMIRQILEGLKALHSREPRILHRDLKPTNILVNVNGDLALSDFGIGRFFPGEGNCYFAYYVCEK